MQKKIYQIIVILFFLSIYTNGNSQNTLNALGLTNSTPAASAYGLRKLSSTYGGNAIQVRRSSDNGTQEIGFTVNGDLDTSTLKNFVVNNNGFVTIWYDQSGNARNLLQTNVSKQPSIVNAGIIYRKNEKPIIFLDGTDDGMYYSGSNYLNSTPISVNIVAASNLNSNSGRRAVQGTNNWLIGPYENKHSWFADDWNHQISSPWSTYSLEKFTIIEPTSNLCSSWRNGISQASNNNKGMPLKLQIGSEGAYAEPLNGFLNEVLTFNLELNVTERLAIENSQPSFITPPLTYTKYYSITNGPWTTSSTWSLTSGGAPISSGYPGVSDTVIIEGGFNVTIAENGVENLNAGSVTIGGSSTSGTLSYPNWNPGSSLTISGDLTIGGSIIGATGALNYSTWGLTIICGRLLKGIGNISRQNPLQQDFTFTGTFTLNSAFTQFRNFIVNGTANVTLSANIETNGSTSPAVNAGGTLDMQTYTIDISSGYGNVNIYGTLIVGGNFGGFGNSNFFVGISSLVLGSSSTVIYSYSGNQSVYPTTYNNLTLSGSGVKSSSGRVSSLNLSSGGTNYSCGANLSFSGGGGSGASGNANADFMPPNNITSVNLTNGGSGYSSDPSVSVNGNCGGSGAVVTATISSTVTVNGTLTLNGGTYSGLSSIVYGASGKLIYNGSSTLTSTNTEWPSSNGPVDVTIGTNGVNLHASRSVNGILALNGIFTTGSNNLNVGGSASVIINSTGSLIISGGTTNFNSRSVTLKSDATGTARIGQITGSLINASNVTVERYIPANRKWRPVCVPLKGASNNSIYFNWQNNGTADGVTGVELWNATGGNGFTNAGAGSANILTYTGGNGTAYSGNYTAVTSTQSQVLFDASGPKPYLLFSTGPFGSSNLLTSSTPTAATLKATGPLAQGSDNFGFTGLAQGYHMIANPYPSAIDFSLIGKTNIDNVIYMFDPKLSGLSGTGNYQTTTFPGGIPTTAPKGGSYGASSSTIIPNGASFFIHCTGGSGSLSFTETCKVSSGDFNIFGRTNNGTNEVFRANLLKPSENNRLTDGVATAYNNVGLAVINSDDARKFNNQIGRAHV